MPSNDCCIFKRQFININQKSHKFILSIVLQQKPIKIYILTVFPEYQMSNAQYFPNNMNTNGTRDPLNQNISYPPPNPDNTFNNNQFNQQTYQYPNNVSAPYPNSNNIYAFDVVEEKPVIQPDPLAHLQDGLLGQARKKFITKVYGILILQLTLTAIMCFISINVRPFLYFQYNNQWLLWVALSIALIVQIFIICSQAGRKHPVNLILLLVFTLCFAYMLSYTCSLVALQYGSNLVSIAVVMTLSLVLALTAYAMFTRTDFTTCWGIMIVIMVELVMFMILIFAFRYEVLSSLYCTLGVILFGVYLVIDTQLIIGGRRYELSMDDYVLGALVLYCDIIQIFLFLLRMMGRR